MTWQVASKAGLLLRSGNDPFVAHELADEAPGLVSQFGWAGTTVDEDGRAAAYAILDAAVTGVPAGGPELLSALDELMDDRGWRLCWFTTHEGVDLPLDERWQLGGRWVWMSATQIADDDSDWQLIELNDEADAEELRAFALPINPLWEGDPGLGKNRFWLAARDASGSLIGCGTVHETEAGIGHLAGLVVDPAYRNQGLGRALVIGLSQRVLTADGVTTLSAYADNASAISVYERVGYRLGHRFRSRFIEPRRTQ